MRIINGQQVAEPIRLVRIKNLSGMRQNFGWIRFMPGEVLEVPSDRVEALLQYPQFASEGPVEIPAPIVQRSVRPTPSTASPLAAGIRSALQPNPPTPEWIADFNRDVFPCQTNEFEPVEKAEETFSATFRVHSLEELNGGVRVILSIAGYLAARGHGVVLSCPRLTLTDEDLAGTGVRVSTKIENADFVIGTYWPTINEVDKARVKGRRVGFLQSDEPSWMEKSSPHRKASVRAFTRRNMAYIAISRHVAQSCANNYQTRIVADIGGNGVDWVDFAPRQNDFERRNAVCAIYRGVWFKNDTFPIEVAQRLKAAIPSMRLLMAGFKRFGNPAIDEYLCNPTREEMALFYSRSDFYVSGSRIEGSPLPPLEAMACGCVPAVTKVGTEEYLRDDENGLVVDGDNPNAAAERILSVYAGEEKRQSLIREGLRTARGRPWSKVGEAFEKALVGLR